MTDPYTLLGLRPGASEEDITRAYRRLAKKYHPDLHPGDPDAARRMSELNAAYDQLRGGAASAGDFSRRSSGADGSGNFTGNPSDPSGFGGFSDPFGFGEASSDTQHRAPQDPFSSVQVYLENGLYEEALHALESVPERSARWYYYSAVCNDACGNTATALLHMQTAVRLEPDNPVYRRVLEHLGQGGRIYAEQSRAYGRPYTGASCICLGLCAARLLCMFCGGTPGMGPPGA